MNETAGSPDKNLLWYKDAIIYELHIKAFCDSNGDGTGDFAGLMTKLDYLQELGVTAIWVLPFYPSPLKDDGYDIADYYSINSRYGTIEQFQQFLTEAHKRNLKVITELVINHTSDQHPWFQKARLAPKGSPERNYYVWSDSPDKYKDVRIIFGDFEASNWSWDPVAQQYFWHRFFHHQPDLNFDNEQVQQEIFKILDFWCAMGVDGFRLDAVPYLFEREGTNGENLPETHAFLKRLRSHVDAHFPGIVFLAEANMWPEDSASYFGDGDECHMNYHFPVMPRMFMALEQEDRYPITDIFEQTPAIPDSCQWALFLRNHDELTLEMVTDEERDFMYKVYAKDPKARINLGIWHRLAPLMDNDRKRIELMNALLFSLPGTPVVYYGDEIGMGDNFYLGDRDGVRTPMQWSPDRNAGFSSANPQQLYLPVILDPEYSYQAVNVELQRQNTSSLFWFMKRIINMRRNYPAFSRGSMRFIQVENPKVLAFTRSYEDEHLLVIVNLSKHAQPAEVDMKAFKGYVPVEAFSKNAFPIISGEQPYFFTLSAHSFQWFILQKLGQSDVVQSLPHFELNNWTEQVGRNRALLNDVLPSYLKRSTWFQGKDRTIHNLSIIEEVDIASGSDRVQLLFVEVTYESGLPEVYQVPLTFVGGDVLGSAYDKYPQAVLARMKMGGEEGFLLDACYVAHFQQTLLAGGASIHNPDRSAAIVFTGDGAAKREVVDIPGADIKMNVVDENNTSIAYQNKIFLKLYRKIEYGQNPDVEIAAYLAEQGKFNHVPAVLGTIELRSAKGCAVLAMMQDMVENHGDGRTYMLDRIGNYIERILARDRQSMDAAARQGSFASPVALEELAPGMQVLLGARAAEKARLLGVRTAEMHRALGADSHLKEFVAEEFSLHYQRSLFSSMLSGVRQIYQYFDAHSAGLPPTVQPEAAKLAGRRETLLAQFKKIYEKKLSAQKMRVHGNLELAKVLLTGSDLVIQDFGGNARRSFSERRLKRSAMRDVADMITSLYAVAYEGFFSDEHMQKEEINDRLPFAEQWAFFMSSFFLKAYNETMAGSPILPAVPEERAVLVQTYLMEEAVHWLNKELATRPDRAIVPLRLLLSLLDSE